MGFLRFSNAMKPPIRHCVTRNATLSQFEPPENWIVGWLNHLSYINLLSRWLNVSPNPIVLPEQPYRHTADSISGNIIWILQAKTHCIRTGRNSFILTTEFKHRPWFVNQQPRFIYRIKIISHNSFNMLKSGTPIIIIYIKGKLHYRRCGLLFRRFRNRKKLIQAPTLSIKVIIKSRGRLPAPVRWSPCLILSFPFLHGHVSHGTTSRSPVPLQSILIPI